MRSTSKERTKKVEGLQQGYGVSPKGAMEMAKEERNKTRTITATHSHTTRVAAISPKTLDTCGQNNSTKTATTMSSTRKFEYTFTN